MNSLESAKDASLVAELQLTGTAADSPAPVHDCWSTIGVRGNGTCRELQKFVHCRNCPVYSAAGMQLLDRPLPADYRRERSEHYAGAKQLRPQSRAKVSLIIFRLGEEWLALPMTVFQEVAERRPIHSLPHRTRDGGPVLGLVNIRGELLICASVARLLGLESPRAEAQTPKASGRTPPSAERSRLLVVNWEGQRLVFPVDEVVGVHRCQPEELTEPPATVAKSARTYTQNVLAWRNRSVGLLDADLLFRALNRSLGAT